MTQPFMRFALAAAVLGSLPAAAPARAQGDIALEPLPRHAPRTSHEDDPPLGVVGELHCNVAGGIGIIIAGKRATTCVYYRVDGRVEFYIGSFGRFGIDVGPASARQAIFEVRTVQPEPMGTLDGDFIGVGAGTSIGRGQSGDALVGGRGERVTIFPIANSRMSGLNLAIAISSLHLRYKGTEGRRETFRNNLPEGLD